METIQTALFENPVKIYVALAFVAVLGLVMYWFQRRLKAAWPAYAAVLAGAVVWGVSTYVVTDREQINAACDKIAKAVASGDMDAIEHLLDEDFTIPDRSRATNRKKAVEWLARQIKEYDIKSVRHKILKLNISTDHADMQIQTDITTGVVPLVRRHWQVEWIKRPDGWRVLKAADRPVTQHDSSNP